MIILEATKEETMALSTTTKIHSTAIVEEGAILGKGVEVGPYAIIESGAKIGDGTKIMAHAYISRYTRVGCNCTIYMGVVLGTEPQDLKFDPSIESWLEIGNSNVLREYVTIHRSSQEGGVTRIGDQNYLMAQCHIGHDCQVGNHNVIANGAMVAGHVELGDNIFISGGVPIHQFVRVGSYSMLSGWCAVSLDVPPYMIAIDRKSVV